jgi:hypothetical protein
MAIVAGFDVHRAQITFDALASSDKRERLTEDVRWSISRAGHAEPWPASVCGLGTGGL